MKLCLWTPKHFNFQVIFACGKISFFWFKYVKTILGLLLLSLSCVQLFATLSFTISWSLLKLTSIESVMSLNHLILCCPLLFLPPIFPSIRVFSNESALHIRWQSFSISPSNDYSGLISFRIDWFGLLAVQGTLKSSPVPQLELAHSWRCWILPQSHSVASSDATQYSEGEAALVILPAIRSKTLDLPWGISALVFSSALWCCPQSPSSLMQEWMNDGKACKEPWIQVQTSFSFDFLFFFHVHCVFETFYSFLATCAKGLLVLRMAVVLMR